MAMVNKTRPYTVNPGFLSSIFSKCAGVPSRYAHDWEERIEAYSCDDEGDGDGTLERNVDQCKKCGILEDDEIFYLGRHWERYYGREYDADYDKKINGHEI